MKVKKISALAAALAASVGAAHAALPTGLDAVATETITNIGLAATLGAGILVVGLGTSIAFDVAKKFIRKGAN
jgi:hypothetical protein